MTQRRQGNGGDREDLPEVAVRNRRGVSIVWIVPLLALLIGAWLAYQSFSERGVEITILFTDAEGLEAGKTKIKYRSLEVGLVRSVQLHDDLRRIVVEAEIDRSFEPHLTVNTNFWVVRPRFGTEGISGLGTYLSGTHVEIDPAPGAPSRLFDGLEQPAASSHGEDGLQLVLTADRLGSLRLGSPVRYRDIEVGEVDSYRMLPQDAGVEIDLFIKQRYQQLVRAKSRFWNDSGVDVSLDANGLSLRADSLAAILGGAISFMTPWEDPGAPCRNGTRFRLHQRYTDQFEPALTRKVTYQMNFDESVRGLKAGAPVEFRGLQVGRVAELNLVLDRERAELRVPVYVDFELERLREGVPSTIQDEQVLAALVEKGLRAQLKTGNLVAGQLFVALDFHPGEPAASIIPAEPYPIFPTVASRLDQLETIAREIYEELRTLPLSDLAESVQQALSSFDELVQNPEIRAVAGDLSQTLESVRALAERVDGKLDALTAGFDEVARKAGTTLEQAGGLLSQVRNSVQDDAPLRLEIDRVLAELHSAARAIRVLAQTLERNPNAALFGKPPTGGSK